AAQKNLDSIPQTSDIAVVIEQQEKETPSLSSAGMGALDQLISAKKTSQSNTDTEREIWAEQVTKNLKKALNGWGFQVNVLGTRLTPNGCLVRLAGSDRLRIEDIESKRTQLLTTHAINVVTVQPKPGEIVVTIASDKRQSVSLWDLWARRQLNRNSAGMNVSFVIGVQEVNGELLYLNLGGDFAGLSGHEPHSLVAGATGSGKSVLLQVLLLDIAATNTKDLAQIILIDPKMGVDYAVLGDLPHMREPIITTKERSTEVLANLVEEMESRYRLFAQAKARDLATYNTKVLAQDRLPMVFLVHDEFADWMFDDAYKEAVGAAVQRLGVKARAAGIHLIFAAQRPDKDVMPMQLRENLGNRLILKVASEATSKIALDR
ncbi:MAG TPA: FtsK/SpoIIIE domain-containing protein, partial [Agitococcus sp.]|nr:FtsK/SpoIIIE domain-containing protein [Agitococcus sp.]